MNAKSNAGVGRHGLERLASGPDADLDAIAPPRRLQVALRDLGALLVELQARQPAAFGEPAGDADRAVAGERPDLERVARADEPHEQLDQRALVGGDLHLGGRHDGRLGPHAVEHVVGPGTPASEVLEQIVGHVDAPERHSGGSYRRGQQATITVNGRKRGAPAASNVSTTTESPSTLTTMRPGPGSGTGPPGFVTSAAVGNAPGETPEKPRRRLFGSLLFDEVALPAIDAAG